MIKDYKISSHNSTVCGYPGRDFDWTKFDWNRETTLSQEQIDYSKGKSSKGSLMDEISKDGYHAPEVSVDDFFIEPNCQYLHVPYAWHEQGTIYRVRPNESMCAGSRFRGKIIKKQTAVKKSDGFWYWRLEMEDLK